MNLLVYLPIIILLTCQPIPTDPAINTQVAINTSQVITGADQIAQYLPLIADKKVALVVNQTSMINDQHLVDTF
ncbi:MAG: hypothetical protein LC127_12025 [Chitinophagales bacterium]|nr:hypothetical protein [Chitinophagales bacterium]